MTNGLRHVGLIADWDEKNDTVFRDAVAAIAEDLANGASFEHSLEHYASLFQVTEAALRHDWNLRKEDNR